MWDLKRQRPVISFNDPNLRARNSCIQWNPEVATQLIVASDDDRKPMLQVPPHACLDGCMRWKSCESLRWGLGTARQNMDP